MLQLGTIVLWTFLSSFLASSAPAQATRIPPEPSCAPCTVALGTPIALTGDFPDGGAPDLPASVARAPDGRFLVLYYGGNMDVIYVYAEDGSFQEALGQSGQGPGEFQLIRRVAISGTTAAVFEASGKMSLIDLRSDSFLRAIALPRSSWDTVFLRSGVMVLSGPLRTRDTAGYPIHVFNDEGTWQNSFGVDEPAYNGSLRVFLLRELTAEAGGDTFWAAPLNQLRFEQWRVDGTLLRTLVAERDRFAPWWEPLDATGVPRPLVNDIFVDEAGLLWVLYWVPKPDWRRYMEPAYDYGRPTGGLQVKPGETNIDAVLEVIDTDTGELVTRAKLQEPWTKFADGHLLWRSSEDPDTSLITVHIVPVTLHR